MVADTILTQTTTVIGWNRVVSFFLFVNIAACHGHTGFDFPTRVFFCKKKK